MPARDMSARSTAAAFPAGGGEMGAAIRAHDWSTSQLGFPDAWPPALRSAVQLCLGTPLVCAVHWGPELNILYNDAYAPALADRHPWALGRPFGQVWAEIWDVLGPQIASIVETGRAFSIEGQLLRMKRHGRLEDTFWTYSFAPILDEGAVAGVFVTALDTTSNVLAEQRLAAERDRQRTLFEQAPGFIAILSGPELRFDFVNQAYRRLFGDRGFVGKTAREVFPDLEGQPFFDLLQSVYASGERFVARAIPIRLQTAPGAEPADRFLDFIYEPVRDEAGAVTGLFVEGYDVTEAHVAQEALRENEARSRALVNASSDVVYRMSADWTDMSRLDGGGVLADTAPASVRWLDEYILPEDRPHILEAIADSVRTTKPFELEHRVRRADCTIGWIFSRAVPVLNDDGEIVEWFGMASDVTERRRTEEQLTGSETRYRQIVEGAEDFAIVALDRDGVITAWNSGAERLVGYAADEAIGRPGAIFFTPEDREAGAVDHEMIRAERAGRAVDERWHLRKDGSRFWGSGLMMRLDGEGGYLKIFRDRTAEHEADRRRNALAQLSDRLRDLQDPSDIGFAAAEVVGRTLGVRRAGYARIDHDRETLHLERDWTAPGVETLAGVIRLRDYGSFVDNMKHGEFVAIGDVRQDHRTSGASADALESRGVRAFVNAPVIEHGRLEAVFFVNHAEVRDWSEADLGLIREVADRTRSAVERARGEAALRASEEFNRRVLASSADCIKVLDLDGQLEFMSEGGMCVMEVDDFSMIRGACWPDFWLGQEHQKAAVAVEEARRGGTARFQGFATTMKGSPRWWDVAVTPINGADGVPEKLLSVSRDVTDYRLAEERLRELNETLETRVADRTAELRFHQAIIEATASPICAFDTDYRLIAFNKAHSDEFFRIFGRRVELGEVFPDLFPPDQAPTMRAFMARALAGESYTVVEEFGDPHLVKPYWEVTYTPIHDEGGRVIAAFHLANDITDRLRAEVELQSAQEQLRQSQKMEAVGQLTGGLAHDFNNLLTGVTGSLELMQSRIAQGRIHDVDRYINAAQGAAKRAAALTHRLLAFSRRQTLDPRPTDVNRLVRGMEDMIRRTVGPQITLEPLIGAAGLWSTLVDQGQLENALLNLCINARDAMPEGGRITIETANRWVDQRMARERDFSPGQYVSLCVSDTGTGMTPEVIEKAFDPFFTTKPIGMGTGLGLSMIYGFAQQSGGQVRIYSELGQGTMVCIYLPRHLAEEAEAEATSEPRDAPRAEAGQTVLVVDDEPTVRMLVTEVLENLGYTAIEAADGASGLRVLQSDAPIDLLVTDVGLPGGMNGRQVADAARVLRPELKVLFITGYAENAVLSHGHLDHDMHILTKPFAMDALATKIRDLISA